MSKGYAFGAAGLVAVLCVALLLGRCGGSSEPAREPRAESDESAAERQAASTATAPALAPVPVLVDGTSPAHSANEPSAVHGAAPAPSATGSAAPPSSAATRINAALARDPKDLALFARIERELKRAPPPAVNAIVELRSKGATREELLAQTRRLLADDFQVRTLVVRWIDEVAPKVPATPGSSPSGPSVVQPIRTK